MICERIVWTVRNPSNFDPSASTPRPIRTLSRRARLLSSLGNSISISLSLPRRVFVTNPSVTNFERSKNACAHSSWPAARGVWTRSSDVSSWIFHQARSRLRPPSQDREDILQRIGDCGPFALEIVQEGSFGNSHFRLFIEAFPVQLFLMRKGAEVTNVGMYLAGFVYVVSPQPPARLGNLWFGVLH